MTKATTSVTQVQGAESYNSGLRHQRLIDAELASMPESGSVHHRVTNLRRCVFLKYYFVELAM